MSEKLIKYYLHPSIKNQFRASRHFIPEGEDIPLHWHEYIEFEFVVSGTGEHTYNNEKHTLRPGSAWMICHCDFHQIIATSKMTIYNIQFSKDFLDEALSANLSFSKFNIQLNPAETSMLMQKVEELIEESHHDFSYRNLMAKCIISEIVVFMIRNSPPKLSLPKHSPVQQLVSYINAHFMENISLTDLANMSSLSPNYLGQLFKNQIGYTFHEFLNRLRLRYACNLLLTSNISIKEIAFLSGYRSVEYFLYIFKAKLNLTPQQYRNRAGVL